MSETFAFCREHSPFVVSTLINTTRLTIADCRCLRVAKPESRPEIGWSLCTTGLRGNMEEPSSRRSVMDALDRMSEKLDVIENEQSRMHGRIGRLEDSLYGEKPQVQDFL